MVTRLSGGLTPGDGSDPRTFPAIWNVTADEIEAQGTAISGAESDIDTLQSDVTANGTAITALQADLIPTDVTSPSAGQKLVFDGTNWVNLEGYVYVDSVYFTSNGTFSKGDYPWLRAIRVKVQGAGGGAGAGADSSGSKTSGGQPAGGGAYAESFITNIAGLSSSETVTVGAGGAGAITGAGSSGGSSSFGSLVSADGSEGGAVGFSTNTARLLLVSADRATGGTGDLVLPGGWGHGVYVLQPGVGRAAGGGAGGDSFLGTGGRETLAPNTAAAQDGNPGLLGGGGASGISINTSDIPAGDDGGDGIVIVELFA